MPTEEGSEDGGKNRFFLTDVNAVPGRQVDLAPISHQLRSVLRLEPGSVITLLDGSGAAYPTRIDSLNAAEATGRVLAKQLVRSEPDLQLTLYQCVLKRERFEWVLQKGTELGVSRFVPVISSRTVVRPAARLLSKYERWSAIVREAAEQSRRGRLPAIEDPLPWREALEQGAGLRLMAWEEARTGGSGLLPEAAGARCISLLVGPEGGISLEEATAATERGWLPLSLGPRVLRAETAAVAAAAVVLHTAGELGGPP
ncbi:MAG: 16S rRNA (uracil(1498)-N(3))-methyltransferase [Caldilineaceae bacterium]|nr:16S rRNA (uracil(1498)-N(3))-methyltransferase [Caldilineaceae bacterium]MDE0339684.1 16S rRNA (uracil(1498)-N(3))-methyltransferase [Caldilineaceae bacterium]